MKKNNTSRTSVDNIDAKGDYAGRAIPQGESIKSPKREPDNKPQMLALLAARNWTPPSDEENPNKEQDKLPRHDIETVEPKDQSLFASAEDKAVGEMFALARDSVGMTKVAASKGSKIARSDLNAFEHGERSPTLRTIRKYAQALGYEVKICIEPAGRG